MFAQLNRGTVLQCYRANELSSFEAYPTKKETKKIQKNILRRNAGVSSPVYDMTTVYTDPIEPFANLPDSNNKYRTSTIKKKKNKGLYNLCKCNDYTDQNYNLNGRYKTWDSLENFYGNADTTQVWPNTNNGRKKLKQVEYIEDTPIVYATDNPKDYIKDTKKHRRKSKTHKKHGRNFKPQIISQEIDERAYPTSAHPDPDDRSVISLFRKEKTKSQKAQYAKENSKLRKKANLKEQIPGDVSIMTSFKGNCPDGICTERAKKNKSYVCNCNNIKIPHLVTPECTDSTCKFARNPLSINSVGKIKDKFLCICHKYSQRVVNMKQQNKNIVNKDQVPMKSNLSKQAARVNNVIKKEHESEQTGEPFFEIQVNSRDMCVLNPLEIKENVLKYGKPEHNEAKCICPSRGRLRDGEVCKGGPCKKAYKNKQVNFNCWCEKKIAECGDATCDRINIGKPKKAHKKTKLIKTDKVNKPLLEVQLDIDKMCVVNPKEIEDKIINNISVDEICSSGVCRDAALKHKIPYFCKCINKKINSDITECHDDTCVGANKKKKSKLSLLCYRICSKSENWSNRNKNNAQKRQKRRSFYEIGPSKLCRGKICTQSENLNYGNGLNSNNIDVTHLPTCDCQECKRLTKSASSRLRDRLKIRKDNIIKSNLDQDVNTHKLKINVNKTSKVENTNKVFDETKYNPKDVTCQCAAVYQTEVKKTELQNLKYQEKMRRYKLKQKQESDRNFERDAKRRAKLDKKAEIAAAKLRLKEIKMMKKKAQEEPLDTNCCTACVLGMLKMGLRTIVFLITITFKIIRNPKKAYWYVRDRIRDPEGTYLKLKTWFQDIIMIKKMEVSEAVRGSDALNILSDSFMDTPFYQSFADKGKSKTEQMAFEQKSKARKRRIRKRDQLALYSCRHALLTTLRRTPCLWVYHLCPNFYPQCLSIVAFMKSFSHILMFLLAFACWTPCILTFELCRACLCCVFCTG